MTTGLFRLLGFPGPDQRDSVRFYFAKDLPYATRIGLAIALLAAGLGLQVALLSVLAGIPFLVAGVGLVLARGFDSRVRLKSFTLDPNWTEVPLSKLVDLERLRKRAVKWDRDALDVSNALGVLGLFAWACAGVVASFVIAYLAGELKVALILLADGAILGVPFWFTGMRFILKQPNLAIRTAIVLKMHEVFERFKKEGEVFKPALLMSRAPDGKMVPVDARFAVSFPDMPAGLYGLQAQINLNLVQGRSYPYFYCVLAAKPGFGLASKTLRTPKGIILEHQEDRRAEVLVIRQKTTKRSGYHTPDKRCAEIFETALSAGRTVCRN